jgi:hypothetical protein
MQQRRAADEAPRPDDPQAAGSRSGICRSPASSRAGNPATGHVHQAPRGCSTRKRGPRIHARVST